MSYRPYLVMRRRRHSNASKSAWQCGLKLTFKKLRMPPPKEEGRHSPIAVLHPSLYPPLQVVGYIHDTPTILSIYQINQSINQFISGISP